MYVEKLLGWNIKRIRDEKRISQKELSLRLSTLDQGYVSRLEDGELNPTTRTLYKIAEALESTVGDLFQTDGVSEEIANAPNIRRPKTRSGRSLEKADRKAASKNK